MATCRRLSGAQRTRQGASSQSRSRVGGSGRAVATRQQAAGLSALTPSSAIVSARRAGEDCPGMEDLPNRRRRVPNRGPRRSRRSEKKAPTLTEQLRPKCRLLALATKHKVCQRLHAQLLSAPRQLDPGRRGSRIQGRKRARTGDARCSK